MEAKSLRNNGNLFFMIVITIPPREFHLYAWKRENLRKNTKFELKMSISRSQMVKMTSKRAPLKG